MVLALYKLQLLPYEGLGIIESTWELFKRRISISHSSVSPAHKLYWFSKPDVLGLVSLVQVPRVKVTDVGH